VTADTYAVVNGRQIMRADVDKALQRAQSSSQVASEPEMLAAKLSVLDELIVEDLLLAKARDLKLEVADKEVDEAFDGLDPLARLVFKRGLIEMAEKHNSTVIISSHSLSVRGRLGASFASIRFIASVINSMSILSSLDKFPRLC
jgi:hypothetical protein